MTQESLRHLAEVLREIEEYQEGVTLMCIPKKPPSRGAAGESLQNTKRATEMNRVERWYPRG